VTEQVIVVRQEREDPRVLAAPVSGR